MNKNEINELKLYLQNLPRMADTGKDERIKNAKKDFWTFIKTYFPHHINDAETDTSVFRNYIHKNLDKLSKRHKKLLIKAYRGGAKTTTITQLFTLWLVVRKEVHNVVLLGSSADTVEETFDFYRTELAYNSSLVHDFNITRPGTWRTSNIVVYIGTHACRLKGYGAGKKIRGIKFLQWRPDLIIVDDVENDEQVESLTQRNKLERWFKKAVMKLPSRKGHYRLIVVGTVLHNDGLLNRLEKRKDFKSFSFPLVLKFPDNPDGNDTKGMVLDDPEIDKLEVLQEYQEDKDSFMSEFQNIALSPEGLLFENYELFERMPVCDIYWMGLDPAMGKKKGDYFAVAVLGKKGDKFYATVKGYRMSPVKLIPRIIATYAKYSKIAPTTMAVETVAFQEFFKDVLKKEAASIGIPLSVKELRNTAPKALRIDSIAPLINDGTILIHQADNLLIEELETYPSSAHDDLLDALEMAYRIFRSGGNINYKEVREKLKKKNFGRFKNKYA